MWESVWGEGPSLEQTKLAMDNTLFRVSISDGDKIVAMARVTGDMEKIGFSANEAQRLRPMHHVD